MQSKRKECSRSRWTWILRKRSRGGCGKWRDILRKVVMWLRAPGQSAWAKAMLLVKAWVQKRWDLSQVLITTSLAPNLKMMSQARAARHKREVKKDRSNLRSKKASGKVMTLSMSQYLILDYNQKIAAASLQTLFQKAWTKGLNQAMKANILKILNSLTQHLLSILIVPSSLHLERSNSQIMFTLTQMQR